MNTNEFLDRNGQVLDMELIFAFNSKDNGKTYVAVDNKADIFESNSRYANLDIFEVVQTKNQYIYISDIPDEDWPTVKKALQFNVFAKMN